MDDADLPSSPRKKLKAEHPQPDETMDHPLIDHSLARDETSSPEKFIDKEVECGITEFVSPDLTGFTGILKKRYTDFLVNEILPSGVVVHLDNLKGPSRLNQKDHGCIRPETIPVNKEKDSNQPPISKGTANVPSKDVDSSASDALGKSEGLEKSTTMSSEDAVGNPKVNIPPHKSHVAEALPQLVEPPISVTDHSEVNVPPHLRSVPQVLPQPIAENSTETIDRSEVKIPPHLRSVPQVLPQPVAEDSIETIDRSEVKIPPHLRSVPQTLPQPVAEDSTETIDRSQVKIPPHLRDVPKSLPHPITNTAIVDYSGVQFPSQETTTHNVGHSEVRVPPHERNVSEENESGIIQPQGLHELEDNCGRKTPPHKRYSSQETDQSKLPPHERHTLAENAQISPSSSAAYEKLEVPKVKRTRFKLRLEPTESGYVEFDGWCKEEAPKDPEPAPSAEGAGTTMSESMSEPVKSSAADWQAYANAPRGHALAKDDKDLLLTFFDARVADAILELYNRIIRLPHKKPKEYGVVKSSKITDRETRTKIHQAIRRIFNSRLETVTDDYGGMIISAAVPNHSWTARNPTTSENHGRPAQQKGELAWLELGGNYLHFTLYKENKDTMEIISYLARQLKMRPHSFQFAGTKDRRGITVQRVSVYRVFADRLINIGRTLRNAKIGNYEYQPHGLQLGELTGNEFVITLRDCHFGDTEVCEIDVARAAQIVRQAIEHFKNKGFINYYGLQRFGTFSTRTDHVGVKMLQGDFKAAVEAILDYNPMSLTAAQNPTLDNGNISNDDKARAYAINSFKTSGRVHPALDELPRKFSAEANIIRHLGVQEKSNDYFGAINMIPRNLRLMYVHAYQSLVWNVAASERWKRFGDIVQEGDLVLVNEHKDKLQSLDKQELIDDDGEVVVRPADDDRAVDAKDFYIRARALRKDEVSSGGYTIFDIVLPTPGYDIIYPANEISQVYQDFMASHRGGGLDPFDMRRKWKDVSLSGSYRKLLARPGPDISYEIKTYDDENEQFVQTDLDRLFRGNQHRQTNGHSNETHDAVYESKVVGDKDAKQSEDELKNTQVEWKGSKMAVILKLQLGTSQYATMALRELMKAGGVRTYKPDFGEGR